MASIRARNAKQESVVGKGPPFYRIAIVFRGSVFGRTFTKACASTVGIATPYNVQSYLNFCIHSTVGRHAPPFNNVHTSHIASEDHRVSGWRRRVAKGNLSPTAVKFARRLTTGRLH